MKMGNPEAAKLTPEQVWEILDLYHNQNERQIDIAARFPVNKQAIHKIVNGKVWPEIHAKFTGEPPPPQPQAEINL